MKNLKHITSFIFDKAQYCVGDRSGNKLMLKINYKDNGFNVVVLEKANLDIKILRKEAAEIATDLLKRKSKVNFAKRN